jgi:MFS family permease
MTSTTRPDAPRANRWAALLVLCTGVLMIVLDMTIVNVALPSIKAHLGFSDTSVAWVVNGCLLAYGGFLLLGGRLGDLFRPPPAPRQRTMWVQVATRGAAAQRRDDEMRDAA